MSVNRTTKAANEFFAAHPVFTTAEFAEWYGRSRQTAERTVEALLAYHVRNGHLVRVRKGMYAAVPPGSAPASVPIDPFLVTGRLAPDAILAYHTALEFHGKAHSPTQEFYYLTSFKARPLDFRGQRFRAVRPPAALRSDQLVQSNVLSRDRLGLSVRVTNLERTIVDVLDRPQLGGGWEEIWRSLASVEFLDLDSVVGYALLLNNATTIAKVGFFLEQHREPLMVTGSHLDPLRRRRPRAPHYLSRADRHPGKLVAGWNLIVPPVVLDKARQEVP